MSPEYRKYVREAVSLALTNLSRTGKGQLAAFEGAALARTTRFKRQRNRTVVVGNRKVCAIIDPFHCPETRTRKQPFPPIDPLTFSTSSWRRAISAIETHQNAWVLYCYGQDLNYDYQVLICQHIWGEFQREIQGQKVTAKVRNRLASLVWLAVQHWVGVRGGLLGHDYYDAELAELVGVAPDNWSKNYASRWDTLQRLVTVLDKDALQSVARSRNARKELLTA
ncbi:bacteriophage antitermination protein Q [Serratia sp. JSRIV004]|uniref:bacteriophage antitermination protein Q n=1 Tax=Serratia sp. JSRIV004 TaxID=2831895 RepID=UPI001CBBCBCC|nr:bacteriophage antitermination protein Q [Serratia sp. JSRIV004]UAN58327.1 hypothetical protein KGP21_04415 [Serratia sp. JSRIV004]